MIMIELLLAEDDVLRLRNSAITEAVTRERAEREAMSDLGAAPWRRLADLLDEVLRTKWEDSAIERAADR